MIYLVVYILGWIVSLFYNYFHPENSLAFNACLIQLVSVVGFFGIFNFIGHVLKRKSVAKSIGWVSNGFQIELGFASLGIGICGILCYWIRDGFWLATIIPFTTFLLGAAILHIHEMIMKKNYAIGNTIIVLPDILMPITLVILYCLK